LPFDAARRTQQQQLIFSRAPYTQTHTFHADIPNLPNV
jgi:hypothetical protein